MDDQALAPYLLGALDHLAEAVALIGPDWCYRHVSPRAAELIGRSVDELVGAHVWDVFPDAVGTAEHAVALRAMQERVPERIAWYFPEVGRWYAQRQVPSGDGLLVLVDDITEQERAAHRAERLVEVGAGLAAATSARDVNDLVVQQVLPQVGAVDGSLVLADLDRGVMRALGWAGLAQHEAWREYPLSRPTPGTTAVRTGTPLFFSRLADVAAQFPEAAAALEGAGRRSMAAVPLPSDGGPIGVLVTSWDRDRVLSGGDRQFLVTAAAMVAQALERASLLDVERRSVRALQRSLLPQALPEVAGLASVVRYVASDRAAQVGGDWYDMVPLPGGAVALVLGDVEGHDLEAAALMGLVRSAVRAYALEGHPPAVLMSRSNAFLGGLDLNRIVTLTYAQVHPRELLITTVSAGHLPTLVVARDGTVAEVPNEIGPPLGVHAGGMHWLETTSQLPEAGLFAMFTDGLVEVRGEDIDTGLERVRRVLAEHRHGTCDEVADLLLQSRGESHDDVALLVARLQDAAGGASQRVGRRLPATPASVTLSRRWIRQLLTAWSVPQDVVEPAELVVSELVTNAARHSEEDLELVVLHTAEVLRLEVSDTSHRMPVAPGESPPDSATSGRGLILVDAVADRWGVDSEGLSKLVWAEIDLPG